MYVCEPDTRPIRLLMYMKRVCVAACIPAVGSPNPTLTSKVGIDAQEGGERNKNYI